MMIKKCFSKINIIKPQETINKDEKGRVLKLYFWEEVVYYEQEDVFLCSLNGAKKKIYAIGNIGFELF